MQTISPHLFDINSFIQTVHRSGGWCPSKSSSDSGGEHHSHHQLQPRWHKSSSNAVVPAKRVTQSVHDPHRVWIRGRHPILRGPVWRGVWAKERKHIKRSSDHPQSEPRTLSCVFLCCKCTLKWFNVAPVQKTPSVFILQLSQLSMCRLNNVGVTLKIPSSKWQQYMSLLRCLQLWLDFFFSSCFHVTFFLS